MGGTGAGRGAGQEQRGDEGRAGESGRGGARAGAPIERGGGDRPVEGDQPHLRAAPYRTPGPGVPSELPRSVGVEGRGWNFRSTGEWVST